MRNLPVSEATDLPQPAEASLEPTKPPAKRIGLGRLVLVLCGLILAITGLMKFGQGVVQIFSGANQDIQRLTKESDDAILAAQKELQAAAPALPALESAINSQPLADIRANRSEEFGKAADAFRKAAEQFRQAAAKLDETKQYNLTEEGLRFVEAKTKWSVAFADLCDLQGQMVAAVLDEAIVDQPQLVQKITELAAKRDAVQKDFAVLDSEFAKIVAELKKDEAK